jgi:hypothetical protein
MFTTASKLTHAYSSQRNNIYMNESASNYEALAVVAGISADSGLEVFAI